MPTYLKATLSVEHGAELCKQSVLYPSTDEHFPPENITVNSLSVALVEDSGYTSVNHLQEDHFSNLGLTFYVMDLTFTLQKRLPLFRSTAAVSSLSIEGDTLCMETDWHYPVLFSMLKVNSNLT